MKTQLSNIAIEGTCNREAVGGLLQYTRESLQAIFILK